MPLFVEELTRTVLESGAAEPAAHQIPVTLHDSLMARLDRLGAAREVAQIASVLGHEFSWELLSAVAAMDDQKLEASLRKLADAELLFVQGIPPEANYRFKHALLQDAAYQSLLRSRRQHYHRQIAQILEQRFPQIAEAQPQLLAHHYTEADLKAQAIQQWQIAGQRAVQRSANAEAVSHFTRALELLATMPESPERWQQELGLLIALGPALIAVKGFGSPEVGKVYARARELCRLAGDTPQLFPVLWGLWVYYTARARHDEARELAEDCMRLSRQTADQDLLMEGHHAMGVTLLAQGEFDAALEHLRQAIAIYDPHRHGSMVYVYGQDSGIVCRSHAAWALWFLGHQDEALKMNAEALELAEKLSHPASLVAAVDFTAWLHQLCGDHQPARERAEAAVELATKHDFAFWMPMGIILRGWALTEQGQVTEGIVEIRRGLDAFRATGAEIMRPYYLGLLAEAYGKLGQPADGLSVIAEALAAVENTGERWWEAELRRLKGELTLMQSEDAKNQQDAEELFRQALALASGQGIKSVQLRIAISLSRLCHKLGRKTDARRTLAEAYSFFDSRFEGETLREARILLEKLS